MKQEQPTRICAKCGDTFEHHQHERSVCEFTPIHQFSTEASYRDALSKFYEEWRNRGRGDAVEDFDEWTVAEIVRLRAELEQVRKERDAWKDASGVESPDDLSKILDDKFSEMPEIAAIGEALSDLAEQGQDLDLAKSWQARAESAERSNKILREALKSDAAGRPVYQLLRIAADILCKGDGPIVDCLRLKADELEALEGGKE